jgi:hypothetical protein
MSLDNEYLNDSVVCYIDNIFTFIKNMIMYDLYDLLKLLIKIILKKKGNFIIMKWILLHTSYEQLWIRLYDLLFMMFKESLDLLNFSFMLHCILLQENVLFNLFDLKRIDFLNNNLNLNLPFNHYRFCS